MLVIAAGIALMGVGHCEVNAEYVSIATVNKEKTFRSVLHLPKRIPRSDAAVTWNRLNYAYITIENVSNEPRPIWDAIWVGSTLMYRKGDYSVLPPTVIPGLQPPMPANLKVILKPGYSILEDIVLSDFWDIDAMKDGTTEATIVYDDERYWPEGETSSAVGFLVYPFKVTVKGDLIFFEPSTKQE
jgi:hypothetical protein